MIDTVNSALTDILTGTDSVSIITAYGIDVEPGSPDRLGRLVDSELTKWRRVVDEAGLTPHPHRGSKPTPPAGCGARVALAAAELAALRS